MPQKITFLKLKILKKKIYQGITINSGMSIFQKINFALRYVDALQSYAENSNSFYQERKSVYWLLSRLKQTFRKPGFPFSFKPIFDHPFISISSKLFTLKNKNLCLYVIQGVINMFLAFPKWLTWLVF